MTDGEQCESAGEQTLAVTMDESGRIAPVAVSPGAATATAADGTRKSVTFSVSSAQVGDSYDGLSSPGHSSTPSPPKVGGRKSLMSMIQDSLVQVR